MLRRAEIRKLQKNVLKPSVLRRAPFILSFCMKNVDSEGQTHKPQ